MQNLLYIFFIIIFSFHSKIAESQKTTKINYKGSIDSLKRDININLSKSELTISKNYILFFELTLNKKKGISGIKPLQENEDNISKEVYNALYKTSEKWINRSRRGLKVIIPIFLIKDTEGSIRNKDFNHTITSKDYKQNNEFLKGFFISPIIINFYYQKN